MCATNVSAVGHTAATHILLSENNVDNVRLKRHATSIEFEIVEKSARRLAAARSPILPMIVFPLTRVESVQAMDRTGFDYYYYYSLNGYKD